MTDKDKIRTEVERCISDYNHWKNRVADCRCSWVDAVTMLEDTLEHISKFIDSLPEEKTSEQLEEEYRNYLKQARMEHKISHSETVAAIYFAFYEKNKFINKACEWLRKELAGYVYAEYVAEELTGEACISDNMIEDFRKAMED